MYPERPSKAQIHEWLAEGKSLGQIAREFGCGRTTVTRWRDSDYVQPEDSKRFRIRYQHPVCYMPCLVAKMEAAGATLESLAKESGVSTGPINRARRGLPIKASLARILYETLNTRQFKRDPRGCRRWSDTTRRNILKGKGLTL